MLLITVLPRPTHVIPLESVTLELGKGCYCETHKDERTKIYCFDCNMNLCPMCCLETHKSHKFEQIETAAEQFCMFFDYDVTQVMSRIDCFRDAIAQLESDNNMALDNIKVIELEVKKRCKEIKQLVDRHERDLLQELQSLKSAAEKQVKLHSDTLQLALAELESFKTSSSELRSKGSPINITQAANDVHDRAKKLLETHVIPGEYRAHSYKFTPGNINKLLADDQNFIGHVVEVRDSGNI